MLIETQRHSSCDRRRLWHSKTFFVPARSTAWRCETGSSPGPWKGDGKPDGTLNERYIHYSRERAKGGVALIQLESIYVRPEGRGNPFQVGCHDDAVIPGLRKIADAIHEHGAKLTMELNHGGRQASITASQRQPIAPSVVPCTFIDPAPCRAR